MGSGHIVTISSFAGKKGGPYQGPYAATKAGINEWSSCIRLELSGTGVSSSVICPGFVSDTGMYFDYNRKASALAGETKPEKVALSVIKAIRRDIQEIVLNPGPMKLYLILNTIHPGIMNAILRVGGVFEYYRTQAEINEREYKDATSR